MPDIVGEIITSKRNYNHTRLKLSTVVEFCSTFRANASIMAQLLNGGGSSVANEVTLA